MHALGAWLATNGEAIYGTSASPFDALAFTTDGTAFTSNVEGAPYRCAA